MTQVRKWVVEQPITPRARTAAQAKQKEVRQAEELDRARRDRELRAEEKKREELRAAGKTPFMVYFEELQAKAAAGDPEAIRLVQVHRSTYELHAREIAEEAARAAAAAQSGS